MTTTPATQHLHRVEVQHDADGDIAFIKFVCDGDATAPCHTWPGCGCESWGGAHGQPEVPGIQKAIAPEPGHEPVQQETCWIDPWFNDAIGNDPDEWLAVYDGEGVDELSAHNLASFERSWRHP